MDFYGTGIDKVDAVDLVALLKKGLALLKMVAFTVCIDDWRPFWKTKPAHCAAVEIALYFVLFHAAIKGRYLE